MITKDTPIAEILMLLGDKVVEIHERDKEIRRLNLIIEEQRKMLDIANKTLDNENG